MKCKECYKELNEMTLYCDRCGAQVANEKVKLSFAIIEKNVVPLSIESDFDSNLIAEIKKAYFLSNIRKDYKGFRRRYIEQYIDYVLLRAYYEKNKVLLTSNEFAKEKALALLESFEQRKMNTTVLEILKEEYVEDYESKVIPRSITDKIENVYCTNFNLRLLNPSRFALKIIVTTFGGIIKMMILFGIIGALLYFGLPMIVPGFDLLSYVTNSSYSFIIIGVVVLLGYFTSKKNRLYYPFEDIIDSNSGFKRHIKTDVKKRIKTLRFRIKKESKSKSKKWVK